MLESYTHRNLILWQKAQELAYDVISFTRRMPTSWANAVIARQVIASATSIAANVAEGHGRYTLGAHRHHLSITKGSTAETDSWLDLLRRDGVLNTEEEGQLHERCDELMRMLTGKTRNLEQIEEQSAAHPHSRKSKEANALYVLDEPQYPFVDTDYI
jgi:four helix bundle protein